MPTAKDADELVEEGNRRYRAGDREGARDCYGLAAAANPGHSRARFSLGVVCHELGDLDEAARHYAAAAETEPRSARALVNWGNVLKDRGDLPGASVLYERALRRDPRDIHALNNLATLAHEAGDLQRAVEFYQRAAAEEPAFVDPRFNLALIALKRHEFIAGWEGYELRFRTTPPVAAIAPSGLPPADPQGITGRRVAIRREQGVGDQLLFSTLLPELARMADCVVEADARLVPAFRRSVAGVTFVTSLAELSGCDCELPLGSLPRLLRQRAADFRRQPAALIRADVARADAIDQVLPAGERIGVAWRTFQGAGRRHVQDRKSAPLASLATLGQSGVSLVDLQYGDVGAEQAAFDASHPGLRSAVPGLDTFNDLEGVLAAIDRCDLIVTTSNVTAHLAGALGKRTWLVYLEANAPFHYWVPGPDGRSLWYPSVEIVTDRAWTSWDQAFAAIADRWRAERQ